MTIISQVDQSTKAVAFSPAKIRLIDAAERLFGEHGISGVSMRSVAEAAQNRNVFAAQYHFGDKDNLILSILLHRRSSIDNHRIRLMEEAGTPLTLAPVDLLVRVIHQGVFDQVAADGARHYARFLRSVILYDKFDRFWAASAPSAQYTVELYRMLRARLLHLPSDVWRMRSRAMGSFGIHSIVDYDIGLTREMSSERFLVELEHMITGALTAPV